jgi:hypothetical protein
MTEGLRVSQTGDYLNHSWVTMRIKTFSLYTLEIVTSD